VTGLFGVNRPFRAFCGPSGRSGFWPQKPPRAAQGLPPKVRSDSIEARENSHPETKIKRLVRPRLSFRHDPAPEREAAI
jgi:hypothetical protein